MIQAGKLRHIVSFDEPVLSQGDNGEEIITFTESFQAWASVEPLTGRERLLANQVDAATDTRIRIRWSPDADAVNAKWRARHRTVIYNIKSVAHVEIGYKEIEIMCESGINAG